MLDKVGSPAEDGSLDEAGSREEAGSVDEADSVNEADSADVAGSVDEADSADEAGSVDEAGSSLGARLRRRQIDEQSARSTTDGLAPAVPRQRDPATVPGDIGAAIETLGEQNPAAAQLLCLCAVLHKAPVPVDVFTRSLGRLPRPLGGVAPFQFNRLVAALVEPGLARRGADGLLVPEPVRTAVRDDLGEAASAVCRSYAGELVAAAVPDEVEASTSWPRWAALAPHLIASDAAHSTDQALRTAACRLVESLLHRGKARPARTIAAELHRGWRDVLGSDHPDTLRCAHELSRALIAAGALLPARKLLDDTVDRLVTRLGSSHPQTRVAAETRRGVLIRMGGMPRPDGARPKAAHRRRKQS
uniref:tetratricopeptide repeat protein n=1 Tax=Paractinoplanes polyasparticus TaxID=2856853 RepID=UPI001C859AC2|nr:tetratricopeptide repeat protein [Actinoplanes polyasparticus]